MLSYQPETWTSARAVFKLYSYYIEEGIVWSSSVVNCTEKAFVMAVLKDLRIYLFQNDYM